MQSTRSAGGATTLSREYFCSDAIYQQETDRIFRRSWSCVGRVTEVPNSGDFFCFQAGVENFIVVRDDTGSVRCFYNVCRHRGTQLCEPERGTFKSRIQCPYHSWSYELDGTLKSAPNMESVTSFDPTSCSLASIPCVEWQGFVMVNRDQHCQPFDSFSVEFNRRLDQWNVARLAVAQRIEYIVKANWKLLFHNFNECYHCSLVHPQLNPVTSVTSADNDFTDGPFLGGPMVLSENYRTISTDGELCGEFFEALDDTDRRRVYFYTLSPNLFISPHPDYVLTHRLDRLGIDSTRIVCEFLFPEHVVDRPDFDPSGAVEFWDLTNRQDWHVCELTQRGVRSESYQPGPYSNLESILAAFDRHYVKLLEN